MIHSHARNEKSPTPLDVQLGTKIKRRRLMMRMSQEALAKEIGLTFQQVQKYERGTNRITVNRLADISRALRVPLGYFLDEKLLGESTEKTAIDDRLYNRDVLDVARAYIQIKNPVFKKRLKRLAQTMVEDGR